VLSATVVGPDPAVADGLATALVAAGPAAPALLASWRPHGWRGCLLTADGELVDPDRILGSNAPAEGLPS
jgi:thiamine biosynthesis lipoprotein ApbE